MPCYFDALTSSRPPVTDPPHMNSVYGAPSYELTSDSVTLSVTRTGGMLGPVTFTCGENLFRPYALAPWQPDELEGGMPNLLKYLRGDFFCLPFGPQDKGAPHGDTANADWHLVQHEENLLHLAIEPDDVGGKVEKILRLRPGHAVIYSEHLISGLEGNFSYGNHPILDFSNLDEGEGRITTSPFRWGSVNPGLFSDPAADEYQTLLPGAHFSTLKEVALADTPPDSPSSSTSSGTTDLTRYPSRKGFEDLVMLVNEDPTPEQPFAWTAAVLNDHVWFSLKNPSDFPATLMWISNGGRRSSPWEGRHLGRIGLEEVCSYFAENVTTARQSLLHEEGVPTTRAFSADKKVSLRILQAVSPVPPDFGAVASILPKGPEMVALTSDTGITIEVAAQWEFVVSPS